MKNFLARLFSPAPLQQHAYDAYAAIVEQSRVPFIYTECKVADTLDGRFDAIILHLWLVMRRIKKEPLNTPALSQRESESEPFIRALQEAFFADMDRSIREMGSTDTGVGKRMKNMAQAFFGRITAYDEAGDDSIALKQALSRNLYRGSPPDDAALERLTSYLRQQQAALEKQTTAELVSGQIIFQAD